MTDWSSARQLRPRRHPVARLEPRHPGAHLHDPHTELVAEQLHRSLGLQPLLDPLKGQRPLTQDCKPTARMTEENLTFLYHSATQDLGTKLTQTQGVTGDKATSAGSQPAKIKLTRLGGVYAVPLQLNHHVVLYGIVDSGASDISIPADILKAMKDDKILSESDFLDEKTYVMADGSKVAAKRYLIKSVRVGEKELNDVTISSTTKNGVILLGQSFLGRFKSWSIDNEDHALILD